MGAVSIRKASAVALVVALMGVSACGDDEEPAAQDAPEATATETPAATAADGGGEPLKVAAVEKDGLSFDKKTLSAKAGSVTITMDNPEGNQAPHAVSVEGAGVQESGKVVQAPGTSTVTADLKAGEYTFYCPVGQHRQNGMEGQLTVE